MQRLESELSHHAEVTRLIFNAISSALGRLPTIPMSEMPQAKDVTEDAVRVAWFALEHASGLGLMALKSFAIEHLALKADDELRNELEALGRCWQELHEAAVTRWGTNDPFPGKWKV